jgi:hypothetical protein
LLHTSHFYKCIVKKEVAISGNFDHSCVSEII